MTLRNGNKKGPIPRRDRTYSFGDTAIKMFKSRFPGERWIPEGNGIGHLRRN